MSETGDGQLKIPRTILSEFDGKLDHEFREQSVLQISGPNCSGKTHIVRQFMNHYPSDSLLNLSGNNMLERINLMNNDVSYFRSALKGKDILFIDDAHRVPKLQDILPSLLEAAPSIKVITSYSMRAIEDLRQIRIYPISFPTLSKMYAGVEAVELLNDVMIYGALPEVILAPTTSQKREILDRIIHSDMLRDVFELERITNSKALMELLYFLSLNINKSLSVNEISGHIKLNPRTTKRYLEILEKHYIVHEHKPYKERLKNEITLLSRYYFYDLGIRNALIMSYGSFNMRSDLEELWANFLVMERHKYHELKGLSHSRDYESFFWETWAGRKVDLLEVDNRVTDAGKIRAFSFSFNSKTRQNVAPSVFSKHYPETHFKLITSSNFLEFIT
ncbi:MAG: AAA family ATPase [Candidatus Ancillula sp.]|jgi:predicted AAA+ superfamily ATPase|nr:AAA family ATPase [Candidatus Ancillula sp.]